MQDRDTPPQEEGSTNGAVGGVHHEEARAGQWAAVRARNSKASSLPQWITAIAPTWATTAMAVADSPGRAFQGLIRWLSPSLCPSLMRTRLRECSPSSKTC